MTNEELQTVVAAVIQSLKTNSKTIAQLTPVTSLATSDSLEVSGGKRIEFSKLKELVASAVVITGESIKSWVVIKSTGDLPKEPTTEERMKAYVLADESTLYVYVGEGGDTLDGSYQSVNMKGKDGAPGEKGDKGESGVHLGDVALVNDLTTGGEVSALTAEMGKVLGSMIGRVVNINDNKTYRLWVGTQDDFDKLGGAYDDDVIYFVGTKQTATVIKAITHGTQSGNTMQFTAVLDPVGSTARVTWSVASTPAGSATINSSGMLTITADCSVVVTAVCGKSTMSSDSVSLQYVSDPSANIAFEDANVKAALLAAMGKPAGGEITYGEAAKWSTTATAQSNIFTNYKTGDNAITKFNEWKYFTHIGNTTCVKDATSLVEVQFPPLDKLFSGGAQINNIGATELVVPCTELGPNGITNCTNLLSLKFTSRLATISGAMTSCSALRTVDMSECTFTTGIGISYCTNLYIVKLPSSLQTVSGQQLRGCPNVKYLVIGDAVNGSDLTSFSPSLYLGPENLEIVLHAPYVAGQITAFATDSKAFAKLYVPDDDVDAYKADSVFSTYASKIYGISELPSGWETPPALT